MRGRDETVRLFENDLLERLSHVHPLTPLLLWMPLIAALAILCALFRIVLGPEWVEPFFACFLVGYLAYDYTHFAIHHRSPRTRLGRYLRRRHMLHHFVTPDARWGVTSPLWDWVFRTTGGRPRAQGRLLATH